MKTVRLEGFEAEIDEGLLDDMELFDAVAAMEAGNLTALSTVVDRVLGVKKAELYDALRGENGRTPVKAVSDAIAEILRQMGGKNS